MIASKRLTVTSLFGLLIFLQKIVFPAPYDKLVTILLQIALLSLAFLLAGFGGTLLTSSISGLLTALLRGDLMFVTLSMAISYGVLVSLFHRVFRVVDSGSFLSRRLIASTLASSFVMGVLSATVSISLGLMPYNVVVFSAIMISGALQGVIGGYFAGVLWNKYVKPMS